MANGISKNTDLEMRKTLRTPLEIKSAGARFVKSVSIKPDNHQRNIDARKQNKEVKKAMTALPDMLDRVATFTAEGQG